MKATYFVKYSTNNESIDGGLTFLTDNSNEKEFDNLADAEAFFNAEVAAVAKSNDTIVTRETMKKHSDNYDLMSNKDYYECSCWLEIIKQDVDDDGDADIDFIKSSNEFFFDDWNINGTFRAFFTK